jgi:hypothetical protein
MISSVRLGAMPSMTLTTAGFKPAISIADRLLAVQAKTKNQ